MTHPTLSRSLALLLATGPLWACGGGLASLEGTVALWHSGHKGDAVARAATEYARFRDANDLEEASVRAHADALARRIDEEPVVARGERLGLPPSERASEGPGALNRDLRADLISHEASRVARALGVIRGLTLHQHGAVVIAVVYSKRVVDADGGVLEELDGAERSVTIKRMALDTLEALR